MFTVQDVSITADRGYSEIHQRTRAGSNNAITVGIIHHPWDMLGGLVFFEPPAMSRKLKRGEQCTMVGPMRSACDTYAPLSGEASAVNGDLETTPGKISQLTYEAWIFRLKPGGKSGLMSVPGAVGCQ